MEKYQTLFPRLTAIILDIILLLPLAIFEQLIKSAEFSPASKWALFFIINSAQIIYFIVMHGLYGQTVGKMLMKVKVLNFSEAKINFRQAIIRDLPQILFIIGSSVFLYPLSLNEIDPNSPDYWKNPFIILITVWG